MRRDIAATVTEAQFQKAVIGAAETFGWSVYHTHDSRRSQAGWPDLVLCRPPRLLFLELKSQRGKVDPAQQDWIDLLRQCPNVLAAVIRPTDYDDLLEVLKSD